MVCYDRSWYLMPRKCTANGGILKVRSLDVPIGSMVLTALGSDTSNLERLT